MTSDLIPMRDMSRVDHLEVVRLIRGPGAEKHQAETHGDAALDIPRGAHRPGLRPHCPALQAMTDDLVPMHVTFRLGHLEVVRLLRDVGSEKQQVEIYGDAD